MRRSTFGLLASERPNSGRSHHDVLSDGASGRFLAVRRHTIAMRTATATVRVGVPGVFECAAPALPRRLGYSAGMRNACQD
jgi:hypothetical protein